MLLYCQTSLCSNFNYTRSVFLSTYGLSKLEIRTQDYYSGFYKGFAFDIHSNGSIKPSAGLNNVTYSIPSFQFQLELGSKRGKISVCNYL